MNARTLQTGLFKLLTILNIKLVTVIVTLHYLFGTISVIGLCTLLYHGIVTATAHCAEGVANALQILHNVDYSVRSLVVHFVAACVGITKKCAGTLDSHNLHTKTDTESYEVVLATILRSSNLTLKTTWADTGTNYITIHTLQGIGGSFGSNLLAVYEVELYLAVTIGTALRKALVNTLVCILQVVLANKTNVHYLLRILATLHK